MTSEPEVATNEPSTARQRDLVALLIALVVAVVLARIVSSLTLRGAVPGPVLQVLLGNVAVWVPLVLGIVWVVRRTGRDLFGRFRVELGDLVFALGIVILARVFDAVLALSFTGTSGLQPAPSLGTPDIGLLLVSAVGIVLISPVLEELFFRGLFQLLFALSHLFLGSATTSLGGVQVFLTTFVLGLLTGTLVAMTNRIGGAIVAHVLFNAVAVVATWPR